MTKIEELEEQIKRHSEVSHILTKQLEELKLSAKEFKVGDYLIQTKDFIGQSSEKGAICKLTKESEEYFYLDWLCDKANGQMNGAYNKVGLRKATKEEIFESVKTDLANV